MKYLREENTEGEFEIEIPKKENSEELNLKKKYHAHFYFVLLWLKKQLNGLEKYHFKPNVFNWKNLVVF
jgi:hypothetical protein